MGVERPADFPAVVRAHWRETLGIIVAASPTAVALQRRSIASIERRLRAAEPAELVRLRLPSSWFVAVIVAPRDDARSITAWASRLPPEDLPRLRFYILPGVRPTDFFGPWYAAELPDPRADGVGNWTEFHKLFGADLNERIYRDAART